MADEFDLKPTSRGEEFLDVILRSLGGDTPDIPQPAWRYEEYLAAIANAIQNGGGGGGSGGGVLFVNMTWNGPTATADKTASEIYNAAQSGVVAFKEDDGEGYSAVGLLHSVRLDSVQYEFYVGNGDGCYVFTASSGSEYPECSAG